jgi:hypothetical protein
MEALLCQWEDWVENANGKKVCRCGHPRTKGFCDLANFDTLEMDQTACEFFAPIIPEVSLAQEDVRQYLEYTETGPVQQP